MKKKIVLFTVLIFLVCTAYRPNNGYMFPRRGTTGISGPGISPLLHLQAPVTGFQLY